MVGCLNKGGNFLVFLLFVFVFCAINVFSISVIYSGIITDSSTQNGITFKIESNSVYGILNGNFVIIDNNDCGVLSNLKVCVQSITQTDMDYTAKITIYDKAYDFTITRTLSKNFMYYNEKINVTVNISNNGFSDVPVFLYTDTYPQEIDPITVDVGNVIDHKFRYVGNLSSQNSEVFSYLINPNAKITANLRGDLLVNSTHFYSGLSLIESTSPILVYTSYDFKNCNVDDVFNYTLFVNNSLNISTDVNVTIVLPESLRFLDGTIKYVANFKFYNDSLQNETFFVKCLYTGNEPITVSTNANNGVSFSLDNILDYVSVVVNRPVISDNINDVYTKGEKGNLFISYENYGNDLHDVTFSINSDLVKNSQVKISNFSANQTYTLLDDDVTIPLDAKSNYFINASYYYYTKYGEQIFDSSFYNISTTELSNITISYVIDGSVNSLNDVHVRVVLQNNMAVPIDNINVYDQFDQKDFKSGVNSNIVSLGSKESKTVYEYVLSTPYVLDTIQKNISTFASYTFGGRNFLVSSSTSYNIIPNTYPVTSFNLNIEKTLDLPANLSVGDIFYVNYKLENDESSSMRNILIEFPFSSDYESLGNRYYLLQKLDPGESVYLNHLEMLRYVLNKTIDLPPTKVYFQEEYGEKYSSISNELQGIFVNYKKYVDGPLIFVNNSFISLVKNGAYFELSVSNLGTSLAYVSLSYNHQTGDIMLSPQNTKVIFYTVNFPGNGNFSIPDVVATYTYQSFNHSMLSSGKNIEYLNYVPENKSVSVKQNNNLGSTPVTENTMVSGSSEPNTVVNTSNDNVGKNTVKVYSSFFVNSWIVITAIIISLILVIIIFYEAKKHKL